MRIAVGSDHAGLELKVHLAAHLTAAGHDVEDLGTSSPDPVDYPDFGAAVGRRVASGGAELGLACCGTGIGISIAANKVRGVRAAVVHDVTSAHLAREHNDANVVCFGARLCGPLVATEALDAFLAARFEGGRHSRRVEKISLLEGSVQGALEGSDRGALAGGAEPGPGGASGGVPTAGALAGSGGAPR